MCIRDSNVNSINFTIDIYVSRIVTEEAKVGYDIINVNCINFT